MSDDLPANFCRINSLVWRGARPTIPQAKRLVSLGVRTAVNLEWEQSDDDIFKGLQVNLIRIKDWEPLPYFAPFLSDRHVILALRELNVRIPAIYVHCRSGQNRTGVIIAAYRIIKLGQSLTDVLSDFKLYKGWWAPMDTSYIYSIFNRRDWFQRQISPNPV